MLEADFARLPDLLGRVPEPAPLEPEPVAQAQPVQLGLF